MSLFAIGIILSVLLIVLNLGDCYTTYTLLTTRTDTKEANVIARFLFNKIGMLPTLVFKMAIFIGIAVYYMTFRFSTEPYNVLTGIGTMDAFFLWVVYHNYSIMKSKPKV